MASLWPWPWLLVAGAGALHGLNPFTGWMLAAACGVRSRNVRQSLRALLPIALGHAAAIAMVAAAAAYGLSLQTWPLPVWSGALLPIVVLMRAMRWRAPRLRAPAGRAGLALWSFAASTLHGTGMMLVPALVPLCLGDSPAKAITASGSLLLALAAVGVHTAAMLAVTGCVALGACRGIEAARRRLAEPKPKTPWRDRIAPGVSALATTQGLAAPVPRSELTASNPGFPASNGRFADVNRA